MNLKEVHNVKSDSPNSELITRDDVPDSPFTIIGIDNEFFGAMGKYRITEPSVNKEVIENELKNITWNRLVQVIMIIFESNKV